MDDGPRLPRRVRPARQRAVHLAAAVRPVLRCRSSTSAGPLRLLHLDLLVLLSFSVSLAFFNHAHIYASVPLAYPPLLYLLARMLALLRRRARPRVPLGPLRLLVPAPWLALGVVFLIGFRVALNVTDSNVIDVGYAGVIGAQRIVDGKPLYGSYPVGQRTRRHLRPGQLRGLHPVRADLRLERHAGTTCPPPTPRRSSSTCSRSRCCSCSAAACAARRWGSPSPTRGSPTRSRCSRWRATPTTRSSRCSCSRRCWPHLPLDARPACARRVRGARRPDQVRPARARAAAGHPRTARACAAAAVRPRAFAVFVARVRWHGAPLVSIPALRHDSLHTIYERTIAYQAEPRLAVLGVGAVRAASAGVQLAVQIAAVAARVGARCDPSPPRPRGPGGGVRGGADRHAAGDRTLVLPVHPVVLPARDGRAAGRASRDSAGARRRPWHQHLLDASRPAVAASSG